MKRFLLIALCAILLFCTGCGAKVSKSYATYGESLLEAVDAYICGGLDAFFSRLALYESSGDSLTQDDYDRMLEYRNKVADYIGVKAR